MSRCQRGSVAVLAMIMVVSTAAVALAMIAMTGSQRTKQTSLEDNRVVQDAFEGGVNVVRDMAARGVLRLPKTVNLKIGGVTETLVVSSTANASISLLGISVTPPSSTILVTATLVYQGSTYREQQIIGCGLLSTVWQYAVYDDGNLSSLLWSVSTGSAGLEGDVWVDGAVSLINVASHIRGDLVATGTILPPTLNVDGTKTSLSPTIAFPTVDKDDYKNVAQVQLASSILNGYVFAAGLASSGYPIIYRDSDLSLSGTFTGNGVIFVKGDVTITSDVVVQAGCHVVIITPGKISVRSSTSNVGAYLYAGGQFSTNGALTSTAGIVASSVSLGGNLNASFDPYVRDNPMGAFKLRLPGVWSGSNANIGPIN